MQLRPPRLLCAGKDPALLQTRCAVLRYSGYEVKAATLGDAETLLRNEVYDLLIISAQLSDGEKARMLSVAGKTPAYVLPGFMFAPELLDQVQRRLPPGVSGSF
jgi:CheY-like chemotaxis protein